jgi:membrane-associated phospholipid phosphatase
MLQGVEVHRSDREAPSIKLLYAAIGVAVATLLVMPVEPALAHAIASYEPSKGWDRILDVLEWVILLPPHTLLLPIALVVAMLVTVLVRPLRGLAPGMMTIAFVHLGSRLVTNWIKDGTGRMRPYQVIEKGLDGSFGWEGGVAFPSGHVTLFASLAIPILYAFPRTRIAAIPLGLIVAYVALARIAVNAHWISDTLGSISLVLLMTWAASLVTRPRPAA